MTDTTEPQSQNYFARHWRGELSLAKSFWLFFVMSCVAVFILLPLLLLLTPQLACAFTKNNDCVFNVMMSILRHHWRTWFLTISAQALLLIWAAIGVVRCSIKRIRNGGGLWKPCLALLLTSLIVTPFFFSIPRQYQNQVKQEQEDLAKESLSQGWGVLSKGQNQSPAYEIDGLTRATPKPPGPALPAPTIYDERVRLNKNDH